MVLCRSPIRRRWKEVRYLLEEKAEADTICKPVFAAEAKASCYLKDHRQCGHGKWCKIADREVTLIHGMVMVSLDRCGIAWRCL